MKQTECQTKREHKTSSLTHNVSSTHNCLNSFESKDQCLLQQRRLPWYVCSPSSHQSHAPSQTQASSWKIIYM